MRHYIGFDLSQEEVSVCVLDEQNRIVKEGMVPTDPDQVALFVKEWAAKTHKAGVEAGALSRWFTEELCIRGLPVICIDSGLMGKILQLNTNKNDRNDAREIARVMRGDHYKEVVPKTKEMVEAANVVSLRGHLVKQRTETSNAIRGTLKSFGITLKRNGRSFAKTVEEVLVKIPGPTANCIRTMLSHLEDLHQRVAEADDQIAQLAAECEVCQLLQTVPGVGPLIALAFVSSVGDPARFSNSRRVAAYYGLTPRQFASGKKNILGPISRHGNKHVRCLLVQAATTLLWLTKGNSKIKRWGLQVYRNTRSKKKASVAVARRLAGLLHRMMLTNTPFLPEGTKANKKGGSI